MTTLHNAYNILYISTLICLSIIILIALIRTITGKLTVDKIIGINLIGTVTVIAICILSKFLNESYIIDVAIIYVILSFISVLILCKTYINLFIKKKKEDNDNDKRMD